MQFASLRSPSGEPTNAAAERSSPSGSPSPNDLDGDTTQQDDEDGPFIQKKEGAPGAVELSVIGRSQAPTNREAAAPIAAMAAPGPVISAGFKLLCVALLVLQNSSVNLFMRYSRGVLKERYLLSTTIVLLEIIKLIFALAMLLLGFKIASPIPLKDLSSRVKAVVWSRSMLIMGLPGLLYYAMNQLNFIGLGNLDASIFSLLAQLKLLSTAFFCRLLLGKKLYWYQHRALVLLVMGVVLVQTGGLQPTSIAPVPCVPESPALVNAHHPSKIQQLSDAASAGTNVAVIPAVPDPTLDSPTPALVVGAPARHLLEASSGVPRGGNTFIGVTACIAIALLSGLAGAFVERQLKGGALSSPILGSGGGQGSPLNIWDRNVQLSIFGIIFGILQIWFGQSEEEAKFVEEYGWLGGYSWISCIVVMLNACGGILVSLVLAYLDNIVRGLATAMGVLLTSIGSYYFFGDIAITMPFLIGMASVLLAVANYQDEPNQPPL